PMPRQSRVQLTACLHRSSFCIRCSCGTPALHSFPTRRSSDLALLYAAHHAIAAVIHHQQDQVALLLHHRGHFTNTQHQAPITHQDRKSTRLNSSHVKISYAVFCLKKKYTDCECK